MALETYTFSLLTLMVFIISTYAEESLIYPEETIESSLFQDFEIQSSLSTFSTSTFSVLPLPPSPSPSPEADSDQSLADSGKPLVPAFFVLGDSSVDCGNNNFLGTFARADHLPYGRDFDTHRPTGRFCNGRIPVDFLASRLGLPFVPSYLGQAGTVESMKRGLNYASAAAGIIFSSGSDLGQHISFAQQIQQVSDTFQQLMLSMGEDEAISIISNSIFYVSIGTNDYIHYYLRNISGVQSLFPSSSFNHFLANTVKQGIKNLYTRNVRKVVVMGLAPMGCAPHYLWRYKSNNGECIQYINNIIMDFNFEMRYMVENLNQQFSDANITFCDVFEGSMDIIRHHQRYGFNVTTEACCGLGKYKGWITCLLPEIACQNASTHIWWDQFHPTDAVNAILAENVWSGRHANMCYPMNMKEMVSPAR